MKHPPDNDAAKKWLLYRREFAQRAVHEPELDLIPRLIDWIVEKGFASSLHAGKSLDHLVISNVANWWKQKRSQRLLVMPVRPKESTVELRHYTQEGLIEQCEVGAERLYEELERLLPKLLREDQHPQDRADKPCNT